MTESLAPRKPANVLFITTDHQRRDAVGFAGNRVVKTPNLDALAARGVFFRNAYTVSPLCQPSRASLISGLYPHQHGISSNRCDPITPDLRQRSFSSELQRVGYHTAFIGRHHFYDFWDEPSFDYRQLRDEVKSFGFDEVVQVNDKPEHSHLDCDYTAYLREQGKLDAYRADLKRGGVIPFSAIQEEDSHDAFMARSALDFLGRQDGQQPFLLWASFGGPHPPYRSVGPYGEMYRADAMPRPLAVDDPDAVQKVQQSYTQYYGMISQIDFWIGRFITCLTERGLLDDTLIIFTSDHGDMFGDHGLWHKRRFYEQSVGVPMVVAGPGVIRTPGKQLDAGKNSPALVDTLSIHASILEAAGLVARDRPGCSLQSVLDGRRHWPRAVFSELGTWLMVRTANWKLTYDPEQGGVQQFYHLLVDPDERVNLAGDPAYRVVEAEHTALLLDWFVRTTTETGKVERQALQRVVVS
ncbi:MAG TPA: sulfatase-like hydrolase/transferase [Chloroflexota bacterium]|nr:sulfatase-like hydrolase/transferase [Chloroflexota bacterium]